jgi:hypothetical protein
MDLAPSHASISSEESIEDSLNDIFPENFVMDSEEELDSFFIKKDSSDDDIFQGTLLDDFATGKDLIHEKENISQQFDDKPNGQKLSDIYARHTKLDLFSENPGLSSPAVPGTYITPQKVRCDKSEDRANDSPDAQRINQKRKIQLPTNTRVMIPKVTIEISSKMNRDKQQPAQLLIYQEEKSTVDNDGSRTPSIFLHLHFLTWRFRNFEEEKLIWRILIIKASGKSLFCSAPWKKKLSSKHQKANRCVGKEDEALKI